MDSNEKQQIRSSKNSLGKHGQNDSNLRVKYVEKKKKVIDKIMFEKFFQDFYKSWSSITNESIPKQTKKALKQFITELFIKVQNDGRNAIDIDYYKMLYKDR